MKLRNVGGIHIMAHPDSTPEKPMDIHYKNGDIIEVDDPHYMEKWPNKFERVSEEAHEDVYAAMTLEELIKFAEEEDIDLKGNTTDRNIIIARIKRANG